MPARPAKPIRRGPKAWGSWHPVASAFHFATKDIRWAPGEEQALVMPSASMRASIDAPASPFKTTKGRGLALPGSQKPDKFTSVLLDRRTWRGFGSTPLTTGQLGRLLDLTFGARMHGTGDAGDHVLFKTSPSAGACHPIEAYVLALRVKGVPPGLYHFSPRTNRLHRVRRGATREQLVGYLSGQWWYRDAAALVLMTAVLSRVRWRYDSPRAYRSVLLDAGHICQTFCLVATWLKLAPFCTQALADSRIERDLGVDGVDEVVLYAAGVGTRPADGRWVQWPGNTPDVPRSSNVHGRHKT